MGCRSKQSRKLLKGCGKVCVAHRPRKKVNRRDAKR